MRPSFDLRENACILCQSLEGAQLELSLPEVLLQAHRLRRLDNESPTADAALRRLLLAILHRVFGPKSRGEWEKLWKNGCFDEKRVLGYFEMHAGRFDLYDLKRPFYQVGSLVEQSPKYAEACKPARELLFERSSYGAARQLFEPPRPGETATVSPAQAARCVVAIQSFHTGGLLSRDSDNGDPTGAKSGLVSGIAVTSVQGNTLFETLVLNLINYPGSGFPSTPEDRPAWEQEPPTRFTRRPCRGLLDWYTWQARRMQLFPNADGRVERFLLLAGVEMTSSEGLVDPMAALTKVMNSGLFPVPLSEHRAPWRDSAALLQLGRHSTGKSGPKAVEGKCAAVVHEAAGRRALRGRALRLQVEGHVTNQAAIVLSCSESIPVAPEFFEDDLQLVGDLRAELKLCEAAAGALKHALSVAFLAILTEGKRKPLKADATKLIDASQALPRFWAALKSHFETFMVELPNARKAASIGFRRAIREEARQHFTAATVESTTPGRLLKGLSLGERTLCRALARLQLSDRALSPKADEDA